MWKMPAKERIQTRIVSASAVKRESAGLTFGLPPPHPLEDVQVKRNTHKYYTAIVLITEMWQNISGENLRLLNWKMLSIFGST